MLSLEEAIMEADDQVARKGLVWDTLRRVASELDRLNISYAVIGGVALQHLGIQRSTQDVDMVVTSTDLDAIHARLIGHGYTRKSPGSKHLRDDVSRVRVRFIVTGEFPGDGKPKSVAFPDPAALPLESDQNISFVDLRALIELKLASAISAAHRIKDRADVLELIHAHSLPASYGDTLDPYVREEFKALAALPPPREPD